MINFIYGVFIAGSMIMAIGAQNAHVIKHGISKINTFYVSFTCFFCDVILMTSGVFFIGSVSSLGKYVNLFICILAICFLLFYSYKSFLSAKGKHDMDMLSSPIVHSRESILKSISSTLAITLLNPHVYLDTVFVVGGYASSLNFQSKFYFLLGALLSSFVWFFSLGYFSRYLSRFFKNNKSWFYFDIFVALFMLILAVNLIFYVIREVF